MAKLLLIAAFGGIGTILRYLVSGWCQPAESDFPWGTLAVNAVGCLVIGLLGAFFSSSAHLVREEYRLALMVGLLGGFTTFSTFALDSMRLLDAGRFGPALSNLVLSNGLGLLAAWLGYRVGLRLFGV